VGEAALRKPLPAEADEGRAAVADAALSVVEHFADLKPRGLPPPE
jgi:hypothetical protein